MDVRCRFVALIAWAVLAGSVSAQPKFKKADPPALQPKVNNPVIQPQPKVNPPVVFQPKVNPPVVQPPKVAPPVVVNPPKVNPPVVQPPKVAPPVVVNPPKVNPPVVQPPKVAPPVVVNPPKVNPPVVQPPKVAPPVVVNPPKVNPPVVQPPKVDTTKNPPPVVNPPKVIPPVVVNPPKVTPPVVQPPKVDTTKTNPPTIKAPSTGIVKIPNFPKAETVKVIPKVDPVKNPPTKVNPEQLSQLKKTQIDGRKKAETDIIANNLKQTTDFKQAQTKAKNELNKTLTTQDLAKARIMENSRFKQQEFLRNKLAGEQPASVSKDFGRLTTGKPSTSTKDLAAMRISNKGNQDLAALMQNTNDPFAKNTLQSALSGKTLTPTQSEYLRAQLNNPALNPRQLAGVSEALQSNADRLRQQDYLRALGGLSGGGAGPFVLPPPPPPGGKGGGSAFVGGLAGGFIGSLIGGLVTPGAGYYDPYGSTIVYVPVGPPIDLSGATGYVTNCPAMIYPPTQGVDNSGTVIVQTISNYTPPPIIAEETTEQPMPIVVDQSSLAVKQVSRFIRFANSTNEKITVSLLVRTATEEGEFAWLPQDPGQGEAAFTIEIMPGEEKDLYSGETQVHGSRARIWATAESGKSWRQFENADFWLVPETEVDGEHAYMAAYPETAIYNLK